MVTEQSFYIRFMKSLSLMRFALLVFLEEMSNAMSNSSSSIMLRCDWLQIRTTTHINTLVIIWFLQAGGDGSRGVRDQTPEYLEIIIRDTPTPVCTTLIRNHHVSPQPCNYTLHGAGEIVYSALGYDLHQHRKIEVFFQIGSISGVKG